ncbi:ATP-dependent Clp protease proteolytic subunit 1 [Rossellomorea marisflavi]|uniref:ClpP family protease n=1 Tax=Rossellomorea marisflavi TaxID=189381 RepID=UPI0025CAE1F8|nr:ATP-dependent Clp protease proteolytic subunit [Rossellomorea marisflavi]GLI82330.1 ATP-dependent Clp protease proteolytic subunit 1 [Rossellomorea marisflavi]
MDLFMEDSKTTLLDQVERELFKDDRVIYLNEDISSYTIANVVPLIHKINKEDADVPVENRKPIHLYITSYGGSAYDGWQIVSSIENSKTPVYTYVEGYAMSMGLPIFLAGHKRILGRYASLLYHELRGGANGTRQDLKRLDKEYDRLQKIYDDYITSKTSIPQEVLETYQERVDDWYIGFEEATKYKMYDESF